MTADSGQERVVRATRDVAAPASTIFELIADPRQQPRWDGNDNLVRASDGQRVHAVGDVFTMTIHNGQTRDNHVVAFDEGRVIAWRPADPGQPPAGHEWRWELEPAGGGHTRVTHIYDWSDLTDERRTDRAASTTSESLRASLDRLAKLAEGH